MIHQRGFKQGETVVLVKGGKKDVRQVDHVTPTGIVVINDDPSSQRFRQDGTCTNNMGHAYIEHLTAAGTFNEQITIYAVFYDMENDIPDAYVTTEVMAKYLLVDARETGDYIAMQITIDEWVKILRSSPPTEG